MANEVIVTANIKKYWIQRVQKNYSYNLKVIISGKIVSKEKGVEILEIDYSVQGNELPVYGRFENNENLLKQIMGIYGMTIVRNGDYLLGQSIMPLVENYLKSMEQKRLTKIRIECDNMNAKLEEERIKKGI